jgi:hypothetical protein
MPTGRGFRRGTGSSSTQEFGTGLPASRLGIARSRRDCHGVYGIQMETAAGVATHSNWRMRIPMGRTMGTTISGGAGENAWGMQSEGLAVKRSREKGMVHNYARQCMDIHRLKRARRCLEGLESCLCI